MLKFRNEKTGKYYALLAHGVDATNARNGLPVVVYTPEDDPHSIYVQDREEKK